MAINKLHIIWIFVTMCSAIALVGFLSMKALNPIMQKNGFSREYSKAMLLHGKVSSRPEDVVDIAGITKENIYFRTKTFGTLFVTDLSFKNGTYIHYDVPNNNRIMSNFNCIFDFGSVNIFAGNLPALIQCKQGEEAKTHNLNCKSFIRSALTSPTTYVVRGFDSSIKTPDPIFMKGNIYTGITTKEHNISETKRQDAGMSTDGMLFYDKKSNLICYIHYYSNQFISLDTNLNLIYKSHTIDTFKTSQISAAKISGNKITSLSPSRVINSCSTIDQGILYVNSLVMADNDNNDRYKTNSDIDAYSIKTGLYLGSFKIPDHKGEKMRRFRIVDKIVIAIYKSYVITYNLPSVEPSIK